MTLEELHINLKELGVLEDRYYLHGLYGSANDEDSLALVMKRGKYTLEYEVYFKERGHKSSILIFTSEDEACQYIYKSLKSSKESDDKYSM